MTSAQQRAELQAQIWGNPDDVRGSGSLLLQAKKHFDNHIIEDGFFGQEINHTTCNLARMNMFSHNINYDKFNIALGNTLIDPYYGDEKPFDASVLFKKETNINTITNEHIARIIEVCA